MSLLEIIYCNIVCSVINNCQFPSYTIDMHVSCTQFILYENTLTLFNTIKAVPASSSSVGFTVILKSSWIHKYSNHLESVKY